MSAKACQGILGRAARRGKTLPEPLRLALERQAGAPVGPPCPAWPPNPQECKQEPVAFEPGAVSRLGGHAWQGGPTGALRADMGDNQLAVAYGIGSYNSEGMLSPNPRAGVYEAATARTLDANGGSPACNQGGIAAVCGGAMSIQGSMLGRSDKNGPRGSGINEEVSFTLTSTDQHAVYAAHPGMFGKVSEGLANTMLSRDWKDPQYVCQPGQPEARAQGPVAFAANQRDEVRGLGPCAGALSAQPGMKQQTFVAQAPGAGGRTVRKLTPRECAMLQGFPADWCSGLETPEPTEADVDFWQWAWEERRRATGEPKRPKSRRQVAEWLRQPHTDSAEYRLWGNGVALPCARFVLSGVVGAVRAASGGGA